VLDLKSVPIVEFAAEFLSAENPPETSDIRIIRPKSTCDDTAGCVITAGEDADCICSYLLGF